MCNVKVSTRFDINSVEVIMENEGRSYLAVS